MLLVGRLLARLLAATGADRRGAVRCGAMAGRAGCAGCATTSDQRGGRVHSAVAVGNVGVVGEVNSGRGCICICRCAVSLYFQLWFRITSDCVWFCLIGLSRLIILFSESGYLVLECERVEYENENAHS